MMQPGASLPGSDWEVRSSSDPLCPRLFVYGTLMRGRSGFRGWREQARARYLGRATARGRLFDLGAYPGALFDPAAESLIPGELYALARPSALEILDQYEGRYFIRRLIRVHPEGGRPQTAWAYHLNRPAPLHRLISTFAPISPTRP